MKKYTLLALACMACTAVTACGGDGGSDADARIVIMADAPRPADAGPDAFIPPTVDCDTVNQDCTDPVLSKCTIVCGPGPGGCGLMRTCLEPTPPEHPNPGDSCLRNPLTGNASVGHDDCAAGLWCSGLGFPDDPVLMAPTTRACRSWCRASTDCDPANDVYCFGLGDLTPRDGFCLPSCDVWNPTGSCTDGMSCQYGGTIEGATGAIAGFCGTPGAVLQNGDCTADECGPGLLCIGNGTVSACEAICDTAGGAAGTHPCTAGTCTTFTDAPMGFGYCM